jgi:hypothetical protein
MLKLKRIGGAVLTLWAAVRWIPDLLESVQATERYGRWTYAYLGAPRSGLLTIAILIVGIGLIFSETIQRKIHAWKSESPPNKRGTANRPKLFLEYDAAIAAKYSLTYSGLFLKNSGGIAHNIHFEPEVKAGISLSMDDPPGSIGTNPFPVVFQVCTVTANGEKVPMGGPLAERFAILFHSLLQEFEDSFEVAINCQDFEGNKFTSKTRFRIDVLTDKITSELA